MNKQLKYVFVTLEVAKLAYEKGFRWCIAIISKNGDITANADKMGIFNLSHIVDSNDVDGDCYNLPTHFQLIMWLHEKHDIDIKLQLNSTFLIVDNVGIRFYDDENECDFEINTALSHALNLLQNHDKTT